ncbi:hypothetical protein BVRB_5g107730 [Beta vulgaris subsp. vulgaris]|nr:hypothetical protein BVRB_5g107730 [Beta vulgaris subsp. vulgaris]
MKREKDGRATGRFPKFTPSPLISIWKIDFISRPFLY